MGTQPPPEIIAAAQAADARWHIPASVGLAQGIDETGWFKHVPCNFDAAGNVTLNSWNCLGIKAKPGVRFVTKLTWEVIGGVTKPLPANFRVFASWNDCYDYWGFLLATTAVYAGARSLLPDIAKFCNALGGSTYEKPAWATDPDYGAKLMAIIEGSNLEQYDR